MRPAGAARSKALGCCPTSPCKARGFVHTKTLLAAPMVVPRRTACRGLALLFYSCRKIRKILQTRYVWNREALYHRFTVCMKHCTFTAELCSAPGGVHVRRWQRFRTTRPVHAYAPRFSSAARPSILRCVLPRCHSGSMRSSRCRATLWW